MEGSLKAEEPFIHTRAATETVRSMAHESPLVRTEEDATDTKIDPFVALPMGAFLPLTLDESGVLDATWGSPRPSLPAAESSLVDDEKPIFTELEAELLLASLEDTGHGEAHETRRDETLTTAVVEKPKKPKIPSRKRQLQEMEYLRAQVVELEAALSRTKEEHSESGGGVEEGVVSDAVWERIAQRQLEEKRRAEIENIKLRSMLEGQLRIAHSLEKLLTKRSLAEAEPLLDASKRPRISELLHSDPGPSAPQLDRQLAEIDAIMEESGLASVDAVELDDCQMKTDDQNQIFVERTMTKLLPFPLHQAGDAAWRRLTPGRLDLSNGYYGTTRRAENVYDIEFSVMTKVRRATARCDGRGAGRRQRTPGERDVIVWQIRAGLNGQALTDHSVGMMDYGYLLVEPVKSASGVPSCILKACVRIWPQLAQSELDRFGLFVDLTLSSFNQNTKTVLQMIENDLLEQSLLSPSVANV